MERYYNIIHEKEEDGGCEELGLTRYCSFFNSHQKHEIQTENDYYNDLDNDSFVTPITSFVAKGIIEESFISTKIEIK